MSLITREALLNATDVRYHDVPLPNGTKARIRSLSEFERSEFDSSVLDSRGDFSTDRLKRQKRRLIALCVVDEEGKRLLKDSEAEALRPVDSAITSALYNAIRIHIGMDEGDLEELVGKSEETGD